MPKKPTTQAVSASAPNARKGRFIDLDLDKLRGGYYTSPEVAAWLCSWAIRSPKDRVLEPSCGDGAFLEAAVKRYTDLGARKSTIAKHLTGVEIIAAEVGRARTKLSCLLGQQAHDVVETADFFGWWKESKQPAFDVVIGNPPFIRYQTFPEPHRSRAMAIMAEQGLSPNRLTNIWVPFVVTAIASLRPGGRLALVLPAELLQVTYAAQLRSFLTDHFASINIVTCNELFFAKAEQEVVLLLADNFLTTASEANTCGVTMTEARTLAEITSQPPSVVLANDQPKTVRHDHEKWLKYFLTEREITLMRTLRASAITTNLSDHASVDVGVVTGKNEFFVLTSAQVAELGLESYTIPLISRSAHLKGARVGKADWKAMASAGDRVHLLHLAPINGSKPSGALARYIRLGEDNEFHTGYKCSIRMPWYAVPSIWTPHGFLFRQIYDFPRMVLNKAGATSTDTIHRITCKGEKPERVISNTYTWRLTRAGRLDDVLEENARIVLMGHMGLPKADCFLLRDIWTKMRDRRMARRRRRTTVTSEGN